MDTTVAELTRPGRAILKKHKEKSRKPQGRKKKKHVERPAKYHNWHTPACWSQVLLAAKEAGPRMSATEIVKSLKRRDPVIFAGISRTTVESWINRSADPPCWINSIITRMRDGTGNMPGHNKGGRRGILANYPNLVNDIKAELRRLREAGAALTVITVRGIIIAKVMQSHPEVFDTAFRDGSMFKVSESYVRGLLRGELGWSMRKATRAAQNKPENWEDLCEKSFFRKAYVIKEEDTPAMLYVNSDQTQVIYAPGNRMTWAPLGSKQVSLVGAEEKRAFTLLVSVVADGTILPFQAVYRGETERSCPSSNAPCMENIKNAGFRLEFSGTKTYWSNQQTMRDFVNHILSPYFNRTKQRHNLPMSQKSLWQIDVWSVHRSEEFRSWMKKNHPTIILDFVPGGCTGIHQPCDVGIQRPLKLSLRRSYHEDIVAEMSGQLEKNGKITLVDDRIGVVRNRSVRWIWNAWKMINDNPSLVLKVRNKYIPIKMPNLTLDSIGLRNVHCPGVESLIHLLGKPKSTPSAS
jgi:hypothetical protein